MSLRKGDGLRFGGRAVELAGMAARLLGWRPAEFWSTTPAELASAVVNEEAIEPFDNGELERLMQRFPDIGE